MKNQQTRAHTHKVPPVGGRAQEAPPKEIWRDWKRSFQFLLAQRLCWFSIWIGNEAEKQTSQEWESQLLNFPFIFPFFFSFSLNRSLIVFVFNFSAFDDMLSLSNHIRYCRVLGWYLNFVWISPLICYSYFFNQNIWTTTTTTQNLTGCEMDMGGKSPIDADSLSLYLNIIFVLNKWGKEMEREDPWQENRIHRNIGWRGVASVRHRNPPIFSSLVGVNGGDRRVRGKKKKKEKRQ